MPSKHIKNETWKKIEEIRLDGIVKLKADIKERELFDLIINRGLKSISQEDLQQLANKEP